MALPQASIDSILRYLDPHLETLQTGFPTSTRPNVPALTKTQKRQKIAATLSTDPAIFLTKWGSVILYPRPAATTDIPTADSVDAAVSATLTNSLTAKEILDFFAPLAENYEIKYNLTRLYQQLEQLTEHAQFVASRNLPLACNKMEIEYQDSLAYQSRDILPEDRRPNPGQGDVFTRSTVSQSTRRNRRLNHLLRYLAPPDQAFPSYMSAAGKRPTAYATMHSGNSNNNSSRNMDSGGGVGNEGLRSNAEQDSQHHPTLASILSISGSLSNLSFSGSTYFSDAEMEARAPELYQQYIGRFMDNDDDDDGGDSDDDNRDGGSSDTVEEDTDDDGQKPVSTNGAGRRQTPSAKPFGSHMGLVDRVLWSVDHPTRSQQKQERQNRAKMARKETTGASSSSTQQSRPQQQQTQQQQRSGSSAIGSSAALKDSESEFEEEFDTESEADDNEMTGITTEKDKNIDDRKGPLRSFITDDDEILSRISVTPPIPPDPIPDMVSSTFASAAMTLKQPTERALFTHVENGLGSDSESDATSDGARELDQATVERKEDQEALRLEFVLLMKQRFLDGLDRDFDYSLVDFDENLDDLEQEDHDQEDRWFDEDDHGQERNSGEGGFTRIARPSIPLTMAFDERVQTWENSAQNGAGDYDY
ncbi:hypothetical protein BGZ99_008898 [Dissophora globulifera]|uniref:CCD97-like C-terminal domain-containing protein n=1 Tax=Dissophora globulifera TaxID=979702 RepID=A0A9P6UP44_9FUNG|nr:hypothetical protein BGZ99_008898 [Dissophora globulifera]